MPACLLFYFWRKTRFLHPSYDFTLNVIFRFSKIYLLTKYQINLVILPVFHWKMHSVFFNFFFITRISTFPLFRITTLAGVVERPWAKIAERCCYLETEIQKNFCSRKPWAEISGQDYVFMFCQPVCKAFVVCSSSKLGIISSKFYPRAYSLT